MLGPAACGRVGTGRYPVRFPLAWSFSPSENDEKVVFLGSFWNRFGIVLASFWHLFGIILASFWHHVARSTATRLVPRYRDTAVFGKVQYRVPRSYQKFVPRTALFSYVPRCTAYRGAQ